MNKIISALLFIALISVSFQQENNDTGKEPAIIDKAAKARIDAVVKAFVDSGEVAGASALIFEKNKKFILMLSAKPTGRPTFLWTAIPLCVSIP
jgi:hypothetical protein